MTKYERKTFPKSTITQHRSVIISNVMPCNNHYFYLEISRKNLLSRTENSMSCLLLYVFNFTHKKNKREREESLRQMTYLRTTCYYSDFRWHNEK